MIIIKFFFNLSHFLVIIINIIISVVKVYKIITKIIINIKIGINKDGFLIIIIISISNNNIKQL